MIRLARNAIIAGLGLVYMPAAGAQQPDAELVSAVVEQINKGLPVDAIDGVPAVSASTATKIGTLKGCSPAVAQDSSARFVRITFRCERADGLPTEQTVIFVFDGSDLTRVSVTLLPTAIGPTSVSMQSAENEKPQKLFRSFVQAVKKQQDPTLDGMIPLSSEQIEQLGLLHVCSWRITHGTNFKGRAAFVRCRKLEGKPDFFISMSIDSEQRPVSVEIDYGQRVTVNSFSR